VTPADVRRVAIGVLAIALREQKARVAALRAEHGRTSRQAQQAVLRLDEMREAHEALSGEQSTERTAKMLLDDLVRALDSGEDTASTLWIARDYLGREQPDDRT
jgi:hypothetical protein